MGTILTILFYVLLVVGAMSAIASFVVLISLSSLVVNLNERLAQLIEILFALGEQRNVDASIERMPGRGGGLQDVPQNPGYDPRYATQAQPSQEMKWGIPKEKMPINPDGKPAEGAWSENL